MTLIVAGDPEFKASVTEALTLICPARVFRLDEPGTVGAAHAVGFCSFYCAHTAGCNLIKDIRQANVTYRIEVSLGNSQTNPNLDIVFWNPDGTLSGIDDEGGKLTLPGVILAHELVHAFIDISNLPRSEAFAVRGENQVRKDLGLPLRLTHSNTPIQDHDKPVLDRKDSERCRCDSRPRPVSRVLRAFLRRVRFS
ncbi:MAG: hypothetical protein ACREL7_12230 [Longimicrobiales bacterium]